MPDKLLFEVQAILIWKNWIQIILVLVFKMLNWVTEMWNLDHDQENVEFRSWVTRMCNSDCESLECGI